MKNLFYLLIVALLMGGCTYKNEALSLDSYKAEYKGPTSKEKKSVYLRWVKDVRTDKRNVGYFLQNGEKFTTFHSDVDFADKYKEGIEYALNLAGFKTDVNANPASLIMEVYIKDIELVYNDKNFDTNLKGEIEIEVVIRKDEETITQNFRQKGGKYVLSSNNSKDLEPFLYTLFSDSINDIVSKLTRF